MKNKILIFIERKSITYVKCLYFIFMLVVLLLEGYSSVDFFNNFFLKIFSTYITENNSMLITIATIFIGIYFSTYTILMSANRESAFGRLSKRNQVALIKILNNGFFHAFIYVLFSLILSITNGFFPLLTSLIIFGLLLIFLYSAFVFGIDIYALIKSDIFNNINEQ